MSSRRTSVIISSYNYGRFLGRAIDSALAQRARDVEVVVVDDGSTDVSPQIIRSYGDRVVPIIKRNGGQASALNAGFAASAGDIVLFLDSDDVLLPDAVARCEDALGDPAVAKVHWPMREIDARGNPTGALTPRHALSDGNVRDAVLTDGPEAYDWPPTSGNAWRRSVLERVLPVPEDVYRVCPDVYLAALAPMFGAMRRLDEPLSMWRAHGGNQTSHDRFERRLPRFVRQWDVACDALADHCRSLGLRIDVSRWRDAAWCHRVRRSVEETCAHVRCGETFVLIDGNDWGADALFFGRRLRHFPENQGRYWGPPADSADAIAALDRARRDGVRFVVMAWPCFWWDEHYHDFVEHLLTRAAIVMANDRVRIFDVGPR